MFKPPLFLLLCARARQSNWHCARANSENGFSLWVFPDFPQSRTQSRDPLGRGTKGSGIIHCVLSSDWFSYFLGETNQNKGDIMLISFVYFLHNFSTNYNANIKEAMNTSKKIARQRSNVYSIKCRVCNNDISQDKHRVNLFGVKSEREGLLRCLQKFLPGDLLHEDDGLSRYICRSCELKISAFLKKEQELKTLFLATESGNRAACERERFKRGRGTVENSVNTLNIDRSPGLPEKKSNPATKSPSGTRIKLAPKFNYRSSSSRIDLMSRLTRLAFIKPAPPASSSSKNICRLAPKFDTPLTTPPIIESSSSQDNSTNSTNANVSFASYP